MLFFKKYSLLILTQLLICASAFAQSPSANVINLAGTWHFKLDSLDTGENEQWFNKSLNNEIKLPGSLTTNNIGNDISLSTPWTGDIIDSSFFIKPEYAKYREPGNFKVPFWLQPTKYYKGAAWYQKEVSIPSSWSKKHITLFLERCHWETTVWVDDTKTNTQISLGAPHEYDLSSLLSPGKHRITICVDNRIKEVNVGSNSHSISDHTQSNWNGMIGKLLLIEEPALHIESVKLFPDIHKKEVVAIINYKNDNNNSIKASFTLKAASGNKAAEALKPLSVQKDLNENNGTVSITYSMGNAPLLWDEFNPNLYSMHISLKANNRTDEKDISFGMHEFKSTNTQLLINGRPTFLRGTLECAVTPLTGYPSTENAFWKNVFSVAKSYGLNHLRFHSWCPPEAAFTAADSAGFYLQIECSSWANQGATIGDGNPLDTFIYNESERIIKNFGNHPSFCMMAYGNEPAGKNHKEYLTKFVEYWKQKDNRRLYTTAAGWPVVDESDYNSSPNPRIQAWGAGVKSIINSKTPSTSYDWNDIISKWQHPTVSHEIGQWCVYPDFKEIAKYTGVLKAKNFEIFRDFLKEHGMQHLEDSFLLASGKLQALCYKADIEAALRTKDFGGFQLLGLNDFPGQGTALVGVVNAMWGDKGYITPKEYSRFCNSVVPLVRFSKLIYTNDETLSATVEVANYGPHEIKNGTAGWQIKNSAGKVVFKGKLDAADISFGNNIHIGNIQTSFSSITNPEKLLVEVTVDGYKNSWDIWVYPHLLPEVKNIYTTQVLDEKALQVLNNGGNVLLNLKKGTLAKDKGGDIAIGFSSIFWNTAWTHGQAPSTLGILCNPTHEALKYFPTEYYSNYEWWDAMTHSNAIILDSVAANLQPIVRVIDDWFTARPLGLLFECKTGKGKLLVSGIDLTTDIDKRPEAKQLLYSLEKYMASTNFNPSQTVSIEKIQSLNK
ncbi:MAG: sugar-binding domain-containing protein [Parafilimonas sp.]